MKFAHVAGARTAPSPELIGTYPACGGPMIARCGTQRRITGCIAERGPAIPGRSQRPPSIAAGRTPQQWQEVIQIDPLTMPTSLYLDAQVLDSSGQITCMGGTSVAGICGD